MAIDILSICLFWATIGKEIEKGKKYSFDFKVKNIILAKFNFLKALRMVNLHNMCERSIRFHMF